MTGSHCPIQTGHNDFNVGVCDRENPGYFVIVTASMQSSLYVCPGSHLYVRYPPASKNKLKNVLVMTEIVIPAFSVFVGHGQIQHAGAEWKGFSSLRYHLYVVPENVNQTDSIFYSYENSLKISKDKSLHFGTEATSRISGNIAANESNRQPPSLRNGNKGNPVTVTLYKRAEPAAIINTEEEQRRSGLEGHDEEDNSRSSRRDEDDDNDFNHSEFDSDSDSLSDGSGVESQPSGQLFIHQEVPRTGMGDV